MLSSFSNSKSSTDAKKTMVIHAMTGLKKLEDAGVTNLIIDVSGNGGGAINYGQLMMKFLFPSSDFNFVAHDTVVTPAKQYFTELYTTKLQQMPRNQSQNIEPQYTSYGLTPNAYEYLDNRPITTSGHLFQPGQELMRGGTRSMFSNIFRTTLNERTSSNPEAKLIRGWSKDNIVILSNGMCGSTCAVFVRTMRDSIGVKSYTFGSPSKMPFQPTGFEGGRVISNIMDLVPPPKDIPASLDAKSVPTKPVLPIQAGITFWESYGIHSDAPTVPLEFVKSPSDAYVVVSNPLDPVEVWKKMSQVMANTPVKGSVGDKFAITPKQGGVPVEIYPTGPTTAGNPTIHIPARSSSRFNSARFTLVFLIIASQLLL
jgi:hypothetical protein